MSHKFKPEVSPLSDYPAPAYPSYTDPEPKAYLQLNPYPFAGTLAGGLALGALGLVGLGASGAAAGGEPVAAASKTSPPEFCAVCTAKSFHAGEGKCGTCGGKSGSPLLKHCPKCAEKNELCRMCGRSTKPHQHPFSLKNGGFPFPVARAIKGKVATPTRLSEREAVLVIQKLFGKAGVKLAADADPKLENVSVALDGWDAEKKIGFEFVTQGDYESGYWLRSTAGMSEAQRKQVEAYGAKALSFGEMARLEALATDKQGYVAVINHRNYPHGWSVVHSDPRMQAKYKEQAAARGDAEKLRKIGAEITKLRAEIIKNGKQVALQKLEKDVRGYLAWLKKQGAL